MKSRKRYIVLGLLLIMLAAAIINYFFMRRLYDKTVAYYNQQDNASELSTIRGVAPQLLKTGDKRGAVLDDHHYVPSWYGDIRIKNTSEKTCELELLAEVPNGPAVKLSSFEVTISLPGAEGKKIVPIFRQDGSGRLLATVTLPEAGTWQATVRMHLDNQTLEFSRRIVIP